MMDDQENQSPPDDQRLAGGYSELSGTEIVADGKLYVQLKISTGEEQDEEEEDNQIGKDNDDGKSENQVCFCQYCNKGFASGKALGGHMRIHAMPKKQPESIGVLDFAKREKKSKKPISNGEASKITCSICGKNFPSMKSLFGHMRCHPEREWRGIQPPTPPTAGPASIAAKNSSSSSEHPPLSLKIDDQTDSADKFPASVTDLAESLRGCWSVTARRGRKTGGGAQASTFSEEEEEEEEQLMREAVDDLMTLAEGRKNSLDLRFNQTGDEEFEGTNSNSMTLIKPQIEDPNLVYHHANRRRIVQESPVEFENAVNFNGDYPVLKLDEGSIDADQSFSLLLESMEKRKGKGKAVIESAASVTEISVQKSGRRKSNCPSDDESDSKTVPMPVNGVVVKKNKKRIKTMKLMDLESKKVAVLSPAAAGPPPEAPEKYRCTTCNKTFPSHQALGGHRSSHNKSKPVNIIQNNVEESSSAGAVPEDNADSEETNSASSNHNPVVSTGNSKQLAAVGATAAHQCRICNKTFSSGQALGGHKRCHWTGPVDIIPPPPPPLAAAVHAVSSQVTSPGEVSQTTGRNILDFDLNELPPMEDDGGIESQQQLHAGAGAGPPAAAHAYVYGSGYVTYGPYGYVATSYNWFA